MLRRGREITTDVEFQAIFAAIENSPLYLPTIPAREKEGEAGTSERRALWASERSEGQEIAMCPYVKVILERT